MRSGALLLSLAWAAAMVAAKPPHILLFIADDTGTADLSYLRESPDILTPTVDKFAKESVRFSNYYVQPVCSPSRTSMLTGRYPIRYGLLHHVYVMGEKFGLYLNETTIPQLLKTAPYNTVMAGKWHAGGSDWGMTPPGRGFDRAPYYFLGGSSDYYRHTSGQGGWKGIDFRNWTSADGVVEYSAYLYAEGAEAAIASHAAAGVDKPLFLYYASQDNHAPLQAPPGYANQSIPDEYRRNFSGMVRIMDEQLRNVTRALERAGYLNDTMIVFTTENPAPTPPTGKNATFTAIGGSNYPQRGFKHTLWGDGAAFVWGAGVPESARGGETRAMVHSVDLFTLIAQAAGVGPERGGFPLDAADGAAVWEAVRSRSPDAAAVRNETLLNYDPLATPGPRGCCGYAGLVWADASTGRQWKLLIDPGQPDGWYPPGSSQSVPPVEEAEAHARAVAADATRPPEARRAAAALEGGLSACAMRRLDAGVRTGPAELRGFDECALRVASALAAEEAPAGPRGDQPWSADGASRHSGREEWTPAIDQECNPRSRLSQAELMRRERAFSWGGAAAALVEAVAQGRAEASGLVGPDGAVRLGPDARLVQLFDLTSDPYQLCDVAAANPSVVQRLASRLDAYIAEAMPDGHGPMDPRGDPSRFGGFWTPWLGTEPGPPGPW